MEKNSDTLTDGQREKLTALRTAVRQLGRVAVAFSAGVDSTLLLAVAREELGPDNVLAITACSPSIPRREINEARAFCSSRGIRHEIVETHEFEIEGFDRNPIDRCYLCKSEILSRIREKAADCGFDTLAEGSNLDDRGDYRPGSRAVREAGVASPLCSAQMTKDDIRSIARSLDLAAWNKPAFACLNTRFAYGDLITPELLGMVDAGEEALRSLGFAQVRVRVSEKTARIEVLPEEIDRLVQPETRHVIIEEFKAIGFTYISVDLQGYRTGSMNESAGV